MSATWKGYEKPGGCAFIPPARERCPDCPTCKYGTLDYAENKEDDRLQCIDCGVMFGEDELIKFKWMRT